MDIGNQKQLFIDDYIIEFTKNVYKMLDQPIKYEGNPILECDQLWEAGLAYATGNVLYDEEEELFKMWYQVVNYDWSDSMLCYALSKDGINWEKPSLGLIEYRRTRNNNIVFGLDVKGFDGPGVFKDDVEIEPQKRYKMLYRCPPPVCAAHSKDGIHWTPLKENPVIPLGSDTHEVVFWDRKLKKYVAHLRLWLPYKEDEPNYRVRVVGRSESEDFVNWTETKPIIKADEQDLPQNRNFYNMEAMQYEGVYIGFVSVYHILPSMEPKIPPDIHWIDRVDVQITFSRDGRRWQRAGNREVFLPTGLEGRSFDWGMIYTLQSPIVVDDEIWIYYVGFGCRHWGIRRGEPQVSGIGLAKLRLDGFVSIDAGEEGTLTTKPFTFEGDRLRINANAKYGSISVEILDSDSKPVPGFSKEYCDALISDEIRHTVTWRKIADVNALQGKEVKLKFYLERAKLFSFGFYNSAD